MTELGHMPEQTSGGVRASCVPRCIALCITGCAAACIAALLAGCLPASLYRPPDVVVPQQWHRYEAGSDGGIRTDCQPTGTSLHLAQPDWWRVFGDPELDRWVEDVLSVNSQLAFAAIRIHQARLRAGIAARNAYPTASAKLELGADGGTGRSGTRRGYSVSLSYELDLWGKLAAERDAASWAARATEAKHEAIRMTLIADTAKHYWKIGYLNQEIVRNDADIANARRTLDIVRARQAVGAANGLDVVRAEQAVATLEVTRLGILQQRTQQRNELAILLNRPPHAWPHEPVRLPDLPLPDVPDSIPADLLSRRPDLHEAEFRLRELLANVDQAQAKVYPTFSLTGSAGRSSTNLVGLLTNPISGIALNAALPLLDWGNRQQEVKVSRDEYEANVATFRQTWYRALAEVDSALSERWQLVQQNGMYAQSLERAKRAEALAHARFVAGLSDVEPWLAEQTKLRQQQRAHETNRLDRLNNLMTLYKALGGGADAQPS